MKILIIDNTLDRDCWGSADLCRLARLAPQSTLYVRRAPEGDLPSNPRDFDRIIVSGSKNSAMDESPWVTQLLHFIEKTVEAKIPYLGVCYGHQVLARALGGLSSVRKAEKAEFGWSKIEVLPSGPSLFKGLPSSFYSFQSHFDEVSSLPPGMKSLARSEWCSIQACQLESLPIFGIQFHPEKTLEEAKKILKNRQRLKKPRVLLNPHQSERLYNPQVGITLFKNFLIEGSDVELKEPH